MKRSGQVGGTRPRRRHALGVARVRGESMQPLLPPRALLLVGYGISPRRGDVVVATLGDGTLAVKRATEQRSHRDGGAAWWLLSDNSAVGVDSRHRGPVREESVHGVVIARLWPRPRRLPRLATPD